MNNRNLIALLLLLIFIDTGFLPSAIQLKIENEFVGINLKQEEQMLLPFENR
jgi:hypothetical protein